MTCPYCADENGVSLFPYYGVAPHVHAPGPVIGSTRVLPPDEWDENFHPDPDEPGCGIYSCPRCGEGKPEGRAAASLGSDTGEKP